MKKKKYNSNTLKISIAAFILIYLTCCIAYTVILNNSVSLIKQRTIADLENKISRVQYVVKAILEKTDTMSVFVKVSKGNMNDFDETARLVLEDENVRNIALAPKGIIEYIYPREDNEAALGLNLLSSENESNAEAIIALSTKKLTIAGPYRLKQGGMAITGRQPIFLTEPDGSESFWGFVTITLNYEEVMKTINMESLYQKGYNYELWRRLPEEKEHQTIISHGIIDDDNYVECSVDILNDVWFLRAKPIGGWVNKIQTRIIFIVIFVIDAISCSFLFMLMYFRDDWKEKASKDSLTRIFNHMYIKSKTNKILGRTNSNKYAFFMLDVDEFKNVNDNLGHPMGDEMLIMLANIIKRNSKEADVAARIGGDEFALLMEYNGDIGEVEKTAESICGEFHQHICKDSHNVEISCSIGISLYPEHGRDWEALVAKADKMLYKCKKEGKNSYAVYSTEYDG